MSGLLQQFVPWDPQLGHLIPPLHVYRDQAGGGLSMSNGTAVYERRTLWKCSSSDSHTKKQRSLRKSSQAELTKTSCDLRMWMF